MGIHRKKSTVAIPVIHLVLLLAGNPEKAVFTIWQRPKPGGSTGYGFGHTPK
jgi:hypothetical protein